MGIIVNQRVMDIIIFQNNYYNNMFNTPISKYLLGKRLIKVNDNKFHIYIHEIRFCMNIVGFSQPT